MRKAGLAAALVVLVLTTVPNATAISGGVSDGDAHPNVGALVMRDAAGVPFRLCAGVLISDTAFLTFAFCIGDVASVIDGGGSVDVTFDTVLDLDSSTFHEVSESFVHPEIQWASFGKAYGVAVLDDPAQNIEPAELATSDDVAALRPSDSLTVVGYGDVADCAGPGPCSYAHGGTRRQADARIAAIYPDVLVLKANQAATGEGGVCRGDSGAPYFLGDMNVVVAQGGGPTQQCHGVSWAYRTDTETARSFLDDFTP